MVRCSLIAPPQILCSGPGGVGLLSFKEDLLTRVKAFAEGLWHVMNLVARPKTESIVDKRICWATSSLDLFL
jgi:hypothetical protein